MKKLTILLVIIFTFLFSTTSWGDWNYLIKSIKGMKFYYDKDRVRKNGKYLYFWMLVDVIKPIRGGLSSKSYFQLECSMLRFKNLNFQLYNKSMGEGEMIGNETPRDEWGYPPPDSVYETLFNKICEEHQ